jgi:hypothetical protein
MEAIRSSETSGTTQRTTRRHIPEEDTLQASNRPSKMHFENICLNMVIAISLVTGSRAHSCGFSKSIFSKGLTDILFVLSYVGSQVDNSGTLVSR